MPEFDFSMYHPLDHWPFTARCREHYGGGRHHLRIAWAFRRRDQVYGWGLRWTTCLIGRHRWDVWRRGGGGLPRTGGPLGQPSDYRAHCRYCPASRTATEDEWW